VTSRVCSARKDDGSACGSPPLRDGDFCLMHDPEHAAEMQEARCLGGLRRRKEKVTSGAYDFEGLSDVGQVRRLLEIAALDALGLENSIARSRTLAYLAQVAVKLLEVGELEERVRELESVLFPRLEARAAWEPRRRGRRWGR
jgi:hypothetical protein